MTPENRTWLDRTAYIDRYSCGATKVLFLSKESFGACFKDEKNINRIAEHCDLNIHLLGYHPDWTVPLFAKEKQHLKYIEQPTTKFLYDNILNYVADNGIRIVIVFSSGVPYSGEFIKRLQKMGVFVACWFGDDPEGSELTSKPYVKHYDYAFCSGVQFDKDNLISDKYHEWGARKVRFVPIGAYPSTYSDDEPVYDGISRDIDIIFVGTNSWQRFPLIMALHRKYGDRFKLYGKWYNSHPHPIKNIAVKLMALIAGLPKIETLPQSDQIATYRRAKIGLNAHLSYGPSNLRSYELPANGVAQVTDNPMGYTGLFVCPYEIRTYKNKNITEMMNEIDFLLANPDERVRMAKAGYERTMKNYKTEHCFKEVIDTIREEMTQTNGVL